MSRSSKASNIHWHEQNITLPERERRNRHQAVCIWFTGLSGSGKSTLANELQTELFSRQIQTYILDGDNIRHGLSKDLGFSDEDRQENIRRIGEVARLFVDAGLIVMTAFISPFRKDRQTVRQLLPAGKFIEVYVDCDLPTCEQRDPKGLYQKARNGEIHSFTGISSAYEIPDHPELTINNGKDSDLAENVGKIIQYLKSNKMIG
jgi:adenylylsulfate kinase